MATRSQIEFDFKKALGQADKIEGIADRLQKISRKELENSLQNLSAGWKGESASLYLQKGNTLQEKIDATAESLYAVAADIRTIARRLYGAEIANLAIIMNQSS